MSQNLRQNDWVEFRDPKTKQVRCGVVISIRNGLARVLLSDKRTLISGPATGFAKRTEPVREFFPPPFPRGATVEFKDERGRRQLGLVEKVSATQAVVVCDAGRSIVRGFPWQFRVVSESLTQHVEDGLMSDYSVNAYRRLRGHGDVPAFSARVLYRGRPLADVLNDGWGAPSSCQPCARVQPKEVRKLEDAVCKWAKQAGEKDSLFALESWIDWFVNFRPYGMTAKDYVSQ